MLNSVHLPQKTKIVQWLDIFLAVSLGFVILERVSTFSLRSQAIGPSQFFGARRKAVLRSEGNA